MTLAGDTARQLLALAATALYLWLLVATIVRARRGRLAAQRQSAALQAAAAGGNTWLVGYASQTGHAEQLAWRTAEALHTAGLAARPVDLAQLTTDVLNSVTRALFIVSTYGEGDPPDGGAVFVRRVMQGPIDLSSLHYAVLALGDRQYRNFCGFGRTLDEWLRSCGATPLFARVEVNGLEPAALADWRHHLSHAAGTDDLPDWQAPRFDDWRLEARELLNPGSAGAPLYRVTLGPADTGAAMNWEAGDLVQIQPPGEAEPPRDYSIASLPGEGALHLLVRLERHEDGRPGLCSGWLCTQLQPGDRLPLRVRAHPNFRIGGNASRPLLLIGNGTGLAGLRAHLKAAAERGVAGHWLTFGERNAAHDALHDHELRDWLRTGLLARLDRVWSRDGTPLRYVQDSLRQQADAVRQWVADGAAIYVCGSLEGMAAGVDAALREVLGEAAVDALAADGRYRRDVY